MEPESDEDDGAGEIVAESPEEEVSGSGSDVAMSRKWFRAQGDEGLGDERRARGDNARARTRLTLSRLADPRQKGSKASTRRLMVSNRVRQVCK